MLFLIFTVVSIVADVLIMNVNATSNDTIFLFLLSIWHFDAFAIAAFLLSYVDCTRWKQLFIIRMIFCCLCLPDRLEGVSFLKLLSLIRLLGWTALYTFYWIVCFSYLLVYILGLPQNYTVILQKMCDNDISDNIEKKSYLRIFYWGLKIAALSVSK